LHYSGAIAFPAPKEIGPWFEQAQTPDMPHQFILVGSNFIDPFTSLAPQTPKTIPLGDDPESLFSGAMAIAVQ
jgi:hypothetical protein